MMQILIVEDEPRLRQDLGDYLELSGFAVATAGTAQAMRQALTEGPAPAIIILDVGLPDGNGFDLATEIRAAHRCGIIMLTAFGDSDSRIRGFDSGADIYLVKHSTLREIEAAIRSLLRRTANPPALGNDADRWILDASNWRLIAPNRQALKLTATEFAFLTLLCQQKGEVCRREELVEALSRPRVQFDNRHLDAIVSRLRRKIESATQLPSAIKVVYGVGYTFTAPVMVE
ncbi:DNA-binding response OmpR family regulator [Sphingopyxis panaciterrae]|uniref:response regulator transcription factor n=1 Tax=Sphingopyxis panaciterrae TaxID=363841 RepID=UPI001424800B|nr:response regulator transcription factor [Sphingopyxis panaciterrae]NIJ37540.1 DNA-binding response OmpR family regulator [Sphingopyxis panaciterrae]